MTDAARATPRLRVLIVGAGRRVENNFLPALACLRDRFDVVGIHARTAERLLPLAERWSVRAYADLAQIDFTTIDVVAISVPTAQNAVVLNALLPHAANLQLVVDTPVVWNRGELRDICPLLRKFQRILVTEDYMNFPTFALIRRAAADGLIGQVSGVTLTNIGYLYHGLALIRSFCEFKRARSLWRRAVGNFGEVVGFNFPGKFRAIVVGPYRSHTTGGITVDGSKGLLTDFSRDASMGIGRPVYTLKIDRTEQGWVRRISLDGATDAYAVDLPEIGAMAAMDFPDKSDLNLLRGCGLMKVFQALYQPENINNAYGIDNAIYDSFMGRWAKAGKFTFDPFTWFGSDLAAAIGKAYGR
jgi:hypothetical protein